MENKTETSNLLKINNISLNHENVDILQDINLQLPLNKATVLIGSNGAGKSSLLKIMAGLIKPTTGSMAYLENKSNMHYEIGYMPEQSKFYAELTVIEQLQFMAAIKCVDQADERIAVLLEELGLKQLAMKRTIHLSLGYRQRLSLAQALINQPEILLLDEPMNGMDPDLLIQFKTMIKNLKSSTSIIISTHMIHDAEEIADYVIFMKQGKVIHVAENDSELALGELYKQVMIQQVEEEHSNE